MLKFFARSAANAATIQKLKGKNDNQQKNFERIKALQQALGQADKRTMILIPYAQQVFYSSVAGCFATN